MRRRDRRRRRKVVLFLLFPLALVLTLVPAAVTRHGRAVLASLTAPVEMALSGAFETVAAVPERLRESEQLVAEKHGLVEENERLRQQRDLYEVWLVEKARRIAQLEGAGGVEGLTDHHDVLAADVVAKDYARRMGDRTARSFLLGVGHADGVREDDLVLHYDAVLGRVDVLTSHTARVLPLTAQAFRIPARTAGTGTEATLFGDGVGGCLLEVYSTQDEVRENDRVLTSGFEGVYPPGLLLGSVSSVKGERYDPERRITVTPTVRFDRVRQVVVVRRRASTP
jgi:rod shape-determining protein MreC